MKARIWKAAKFAATVVAIAAALVSATAWWAGRDPLYFLPRGSTAPVVRVDRIEHRAGRVFEHVSISDASLGSIGFTLSLPLPAGKLPVVMVLGGLATGEHNIRAIGDAGDNVVVGYDWPLAGAPRPADVLRLPALRAQALSVPGQVTAALHWLLDQTWSDRDRVALVGFSLGSVAAPAVQHVAMSEGIPIGATVLAYGGAPIAALVAGNTRLRPSWARPLLAFGAQLLLTPVDPAVHLPGLTGRFLVLGSRDDSIVSEPASRRLEALTPMPKVTIRLPGGHIGTGADREALLESAMAVTRCWLIAAGAVNPPAFAPTDQCQAQAQQTGAPIDSGASGAPGGT